MAAVTELSFLLFALINNIHAEERITIRYEGGSYTFNPPKEANFCLISRFVGEEKLLLWNTSALWSENSTVPEDLKQRLSVGSVNNISSYMIQNLTHSDSSQNQEECWTEGKVTSEKDISLTVCKTEDEDKVIPVRLGGTVDLPCEGAADNLDIQWLMIDSRYQEEIWTKVFEDSTPSVMDNIKGVKTISALHLSNFMPTTFQQYICLVMNQQQCVSSHPVQVRLQEELMYHSVEETAVLQCNVTDFGDDQPPVWKKWNLKRSSDTDPGQQYLGQNNSLVFSSLTLNHSGVFYCSKTLVTVRAYWLVVCPKFAPPAVELFSEGDDVTLRCRNWEEGMWYLWFMKSNKTGGRIFNTYNIRSDLRRMNIFSLNGSLVISNVSLEDTGEYWCAVLDSDLQCVSTTKILLKYREPFGIHFTLYTVRNSLLSGLLVILCVVVVAVIQRSRRGEQRSAETES
ncbi:vascular endothelial growth factor receptor 2-like isoform X2 [Dicentrarchus labrax]|uniref:vascular endothelial growth factor receptor 2-like isoform X2 n=1 Tax=Dicentrarchus labrax TaxID=13489 RepID=UPI0021F68B21|nr:vascular endothelial growth factor receptor 2-like isoform X2 [Dicentrarchus labrax]